MASAVAEHEAAAAKELGLTRERILQGLGDALEMARAQNNPVAMVAALREAAKISGFYAPERTRVEISVEGAARLAKMDRLSDAELLAIIEERPHVS